MSSRVELWLLAIVAVAIVISGTMTGISVFR